MFLNSNKKIILFLISCIFPLEYGLDVFFNKDLSIYSKSRVAVLANSSSLNKNFENTVDLILNHKDLNLVKIFSPEHGFYANHSAGAFVNNEKFDDVDIISLYGDSKKPKIKDLENIDLLIIDIQDIGSTYYTYISTVTYLLDAAGYLNINVLIFDRPNPVGRSVFGPVKKNFNFIGLHPIPIRHGMTLGELCVMINQEGWIENNVKNLNIIKMQNLNQFDEVNHWEAPSPNIPDVETAFIYTGFCLFEATNISEGRGTDNPFKIIGAPWINSKELINFIQSSKFKKYKNKILVKEIEFLPKSKSGSENPKYKNQICKGVFINIDKSVEPLEIAMYLIEYFYKNYEEFKLNENFLDILYGSKDFRKCLEKKCDLDSIFKSIEIDTTKFIKLREKYLLY